MATPLLPSYLLALVPVLLLSSYLLLASTRRRRGSGVAAAKDVDGALPLPPGPAPVPVLGNLHLLGPLPHQSLRELARRHGPVMQLRLGTVPAVVVSSASAAREVMKTHDGDCCSRPSSSPGPRRMSYGLKDVAFAPYGEYWREMRRLFVVELLSMRRVKAAWRAREHHVDRLVAALMTGAAAAAEKKAVALDEHVFALADGIIGTVAFGNMYGSERFKKKQFQHVVGDAMNMMASFSAEDFFPNAGGRLVDRLTGLVARRERIFRDLDAFFDAVIDHHMDPARVHLDPSRPTPEHGPDLIDAFVALMKERRHHQEGSSLRFTRDHIKGLLSNVFTASVDTSSVTMVWAMAELIRRPAMMKKVQEEIRAAVGDKAERVHHDDLPKLRYLKMVVKETLRLHPAVPLLLPRETLRHVGICGYDVPAKTRVLVNAWAIGRDPAIWGNNPEVFDPDRFDGSDTDFNGAHFELLPFGAGRRMCPGMAMGLATVTFTLANLLYCFDWALPEGMAPEDVDMEEAGGLTVHKKTPLLLVPTRYTRHC
ncbi:hypothetical protein HU200_009529 [Digitaria exilis]|uniref:Cytochrome P450 n=1 Tax=Digitaria exilis TaxID=1010633 RepID=A0A835FJB9_9POAL|nr:hypothetical protein HU200_009529 [Digitaria exilis]